METIENVVTKNLIFAELPLLNPVNQKTKGKMSTKKKKKVGVKKLFA